MAAHVPTVEYIAAWATVGTAVGTGLLAFATYSLARKTKRMAQAAEDELHVVRVQAESMAQQAKATRRNLRRATGSIV
jgi:hypothetical protein